MVYIDSISYFAGVPLANSHSPESFRKTALDFRSPAGTLRSVEHLHSSGSNMSSPRIGNYTCNYYPFMVLVGWSGAFC